MNHRMPNQPAMSSPQERKTALFALLVEKVVTERSALNLS